MSFMDELAAKERSEYAEFVREQRMEQLGAMEESLAGPRSTMERHSQNLQSIYEPAPKMTWDDAKLAGLPHIEERVRIWRAEMSEPSIAEVMSAWLKANPTPEPVAKPKRADMYGNDVQRELAADVRVGWRG